MPVTQRANLTCPGCGTKFLQRLVPPEPGWEDDTDFCDQCTAHIAHKEAILTDRDKLFDHVRAVKDGWANVQGKGLTREAEVGAFLSIFHPAIYQDNNRRNAILAAVERPKESGS